ncbi:hypothetical protein [Thermosyntropha sp.]|uniref:hypothetical protein n=1 Tax=Thermosyntropha sp. TaxID=2740820 RepID=UPI0025D64BEE|nr:hypothetical protein [Thermosyntropha sp.]MBO8159887.1 hypothetical protein [Thermosyntropha sp.]
MKDEYGDKIDLSFEDTSQHVLDPDSEIKRLQEQGKSFPMVFVEEKLVMDGGIDKKELKKLIEENL